MLTLEHALRSLNAYPIPSDTLRAIAAACQLDLTAALTPTAIQSRPYQLSRAHVLHYLALAPNISEEGQSYTISDEARKRMRAEAARVLSSLGEATTAITYGYKGQRL